MTRYELAEKFEKESLDLCYAIEELPASEQQTKVSMLASNLYSKIRKPELCKIANIVNGLFLDSDYAGKDWAAVRKSLIKALNSHINNLIIEEKIRELGKMFLRPGWEEIENYLIDRITELKKELM